VTEPKLPEELDEQAMLYALGVLDSVDRQAFQVRLQGESHLLRQAAKAYETTTDALAAVVKPVTPSATLRERLVNDVAAEASHEAEQFELAANTLTLGSVPVKPRDALRERLLSRVGGYSDVRRDIEDSAPVLKEAPALDDWGMSESKRHLSQDAGPQTTWLRSCWTAVSNFLRTLLIRSVTSERVRYWKAKMAFQQPTKGLTFIKASEGTWWTVAQGVTAKVFSFDPASRRITTLLRFAPGTSYSSHRHAEAEELFVLEGGCSIAGREMTVGDYHRAEAGTEHYDTSTDDGCLLLVISSPHNEMLR
jgi:quercetin dioxygenase-like cupin family protein